MYVLTNDVGGPDESTSTGRVWKIVPFTDSTPVPVASVTTPVPVVPVTTPVPVTPVFTHHVEPGHHPEPPGHHDHNR